MTLNRFLKTNMYCLTNSAKVVHATVLHLTSEDDEKKTTNMTFAGTKHISTQKLCWNHSTNLYKLPFGCHSCAAIFFCITQKKDPIANISITKCIILHILDFMFTTRSYSVLNTLFCVYSPYSLSAFLVGFSSFSR